MLSARAYPIGYLSALEKKQVDDEEEEEKEREEEREENSSPLRTPYLQLRSYPYIHSEPRLSWN